MTFAVHMTNILAHTEIEFGTVYVGTSLFHHIVHASPSYKHHVLCRDTSDVRVDHPRADTNVERSQQ